MGRLQVDWVGSSETFSYNITYISEQIMFLILFYFLLLGPGGGGILVSNFIVIIAIIVLHLVINRSFI
jgi:hypothetical protein